MKKTICVALLILSIGVGPAFAEGFRYTLRAGYTVGGAMPAGMPAEIRSLDAYGLRPNFQIGATVERPFSAKWGVMSGLLLENKGMQIDATVKNYHITMVRGGETLEGRFTGHNHTTESQLQLALPILGTYNIGHVTVSAGLYGALVLGRQFEGYAYDGYLRRRTSENMAVDDPRGERVEIGSLSTERGSYDFAADMSRLQCGLMVGADWFPKGGHWGGYVQVSYGLTGIHKSSFATLDQKLHPFFGTFGVAYKL